MSQLVQTRGLLPYDSEIEYLESTGTQYIDTGVVPTDDHIIYCLFDMAISGNAKQACVFGCDATSGSNSLYIVIASDGHFVYKIGSTSDTSWPSGNMFAHNPFEVTFLSKKAITVMPSNPTYVRTFSGSALSIDRPLLLFRRHGQAYNGGRIFACSISLSGTLVRDYVPVRVGSIGYLYDRVSGELFGNAGTGNFVLGPDTVAQDDTFAQGVTLPTRIEVAGVRRKTIKFIRSTGTYYPSKEVTYNGSYLNTGVNPDAKTLIKIICRITPGSTFQHWAYLLGAQTTNDNANTFSVRGLSTNRLSPPWRNYRWGHSAWQDFGITTDSWSGSFDWHTIIISHSGLVLDGVLYPATGTPNASVPNYPIFVGSINRKGAAMNCIPLDIASLKIWNGTTLQFDGKPAVVNGVVGLKDSVSSSLFSSRLASKPYQLLQEPTS